MAIRTWGRMLLAGVGVGAFAGAAQLGIAYGLAVVRFGRAFDPTADGLWAAQVAWVAWFAIVASVAGAIAVGFLAYRHGVALTAIAPRLAAAGASAIGALAVAPLAMLPTRNAQLTSINPALTAGLGAVLGALIGMAAAVTTLSQRPFRWNIVIVAGSVWLVTLLSVAPSLGPTDPLPDVRLGVVDAASLSEATRNRLAVLTMPGLALVAGLVCGLLARAGRYSTVVAAGCGAIGPALLALAYLAAGPGGGDSYQAAPYWGALIATGAGALGSVLATAIPLPGMAPARDASRGLGAGADRPGDPATLASPDQSHGEHADWNAPTGPAESTAEPAESRAEPAETPAEPGESPTEPAESPTEPAESPTEPAESPTGRALTQPEPAAAPPGIPWFDQARTPAEAGAEWPGRRNPEAGVPEREESTQTTTEPAPAPGTRAAHLGESWNAFPATDHARSGAAGTMATAASTAAASAADAGPAEPSPTPESAGSDEPGRGRFRRSRRPAPRRDDEYVDWVSGLGGSDEPTDDEPETRRTFRRSTPPEPD